ncbi:tetratricopeptide repeat protein [bacterium]|nr:tetratricopeptide repeat protein [bacterium]
MDKPSSERNSKELYCLALRLRAELLNIMGKYALAMSDAKKGFEISVLPWDRKKMKLMSAHIQRKRNKYPEVIRIVEEVLAELESSGEEDLRFDAMNLMGICNMYLGEYEPAADYFVKALELNKIIRDEFYQGALNNNLGAIYYHQGFYEKALTYYRRAAKSFAKIDDRRVLGMATKNIGIIYYHTGRYAESEKKLLEFLEIAKQTSYTHGIAGVYNDLGGMNAARGDLKKSLHYFEKYLEIVLQLDDQKGIGNAYMNMGNVYAKTKEYEKGLSLFAKSLKIARKRKFLRMIGINLINFASTYVEMADYDRVLPYLEEARSLFSTMKDHRHLNEVLRHLSDYYHLIGKYIDRDKTISKALRLANEVALPRLQYLALYKMGEHLAEENPAEAAIKFEKALKLAEENDIRNEMGYILRALGNVYIKNKETAPAGRALLKRAAALGTDPEQTSKIHI